MYCPLSGLMLTIQRTAKVTQANWHHHIWLCGVTEFTVYTGNGNAQCPYTINTSYTSNEHACTSLHSLTNIHTIWRGRGGCHILHTEMHLVTLYQMWLCIFTCCWKVHKTTSLQYCNQVMDHILPLPTGQRKVSTVRNMTIYVNSWYTL